MTHGVRHNFSDLQVFPINALPAAQLVPKGIDTLCHNVSIKSEAVRRYYEQVAADLLFFFSDIAIQAEAMGASVRFAQDEMPAVKGPAARIDTPQARQVPRMVLNSRVVQDLRRAFVHRAIAALVYGPFTVAGQLAGEQTLLRQVREGPEHLQGLLTKATQMAEDYACLLLEAGADVLWVSDPLAALLPPADFEAFAGRYLRRLFRLQVDGRSILHICGDISDLIDPILATGAGGISFDQCMELMTVEDQLPDNVALIGNLNPVEVVTMASAEAVAAATSELTTTMAIRSNFVLSTGCALPPATPLENIQSFVDSGRAHLSMMRPHAEYLAFLVAAVVAGDETATITAIEQGWAARCDPYLMLDAGLVRAVRKASARYESKKCYLPEILMTVDAFYQGMKHLTTRISHRRISGPQVVLGTVHGDLHAIGKDLVRIMLEVNGFGVLDLGVDVPAERFTAAVQQTRCSIVGLSAFVTSARRQLSALIATIRGHGGDADLKVIVGGAAVNAAIAAEVGADGYARDCIAAVKLVRRLANQAGRGKHAPAN